MLNLSGTDKNHSAFDIDLDVPLFAGISGGRTSGMMAALLPQKTILLFENTGREHAGTYDFLQALHEALDFRIVWLEYVKPLIKGAAPREARYKIVNYKTADRSGGPFQAFMETLTEYRSLQKGLPPTVPWPGARLCTAQMKHKTGERYIASLGIDTYAMAVGLRADEPTRVQSLMKQASQAKDFVCPLADAGIIKADVLSFWQRQSFDLKIAEYQGNCDGCFLKDQADLSRALGEMSDPEFWFLMEMTYPRFGGTDFAGYRQLHGEYGLRLEIEALLTAYLNLGIEKKEAIQRTEKYFRVEQVKPVFGTPRRFLNVIRQEHKRCVEGAKTISCSCEASFNISDEIV